MIANVVKSGSYGLRDLGKSILICAFKDGNRIGLSISSRSFQRLVKHTFLTGENVILKESKSRCGLVQVARYTTAEAAQPSDSLPVNNNRPNQDAKAFLQKHDIVIKGCPCPEPVLSVQEAEFPSYINDVLIRRNIQDPTPIQSMSWPLALQGRDFVGISPTGSGKTLGFTIPAVIHTMKLKETTPERSNSPFVLVLAPTRELAQQIEEVVKWFESGSLRCVCLFGGSSKLVQMRRLDRGVDICIATPGRCLDMLTDGVMTLDNCTYLVLDEADRMLDMGFLPQMERIIEKTPKRKQVLMWSATWPHEVRQIAEKFLSDYAYLSIGSAELKPNANVKQVVEMCHGQEDKNKRLLSVLRESLADDPKAKILIFAETKFRVDVLQRMLRTERFSVVAIHGDKTQAQRDNAMESFRRGRTRILIATAVASRGIDVSDITQVINYDCPTHLDEYIHKIGRTGRHLNKGLATTFVTPEDTTAGYLVDILNECNQPVPKELYSMENAKSSYNKFGYKSSRGKKSFGFRPPFNTRTNRFKDW